MHYAVAIPLGEARYVMNRLTGSKTVVDLYVLPDPRFEVIVHDARKQTGPISGSLEMIGQ